jgi:hypothetical protein
MSHAGLAPWAEFMRPRGWRVRTLRLRGVLSQGLALPLAILGGEAPEVGADVREQLKVTNFEAALPDAREGARAGSEPRVARGRAPQPHRSTTTSC